MIKMTFEHQGLKVSIQDEDAEEIFEVLELCVTILKASGYAEENINEGIKELNKQLNN
jgi:predicted house-cleaning noncanonical NTP pyrophosphatase (MazG superfamily)